MTARRGVEAAPLPVVPTPEGMARGRRKGGAEAAPAAAAGTPAVRMTVEELAHRTGLTVRNIRALQTHGLLKPPHLQGRKGFYDERHLARVRIVHRLQARGYSISSIGDLLARWEEGAGMSAVLGLEEAVTTPLAGAPRSLDEAAVLALFPELGAQPALRRRALSAALLFEREGSLVAPNAELLEIGRAMVDSGLPVAALLEELVFLRETSEAVVGRMLGVFHEHVLGPLMAKGLPASKLGEVAAVLLRLRPLAVRTLTLLVADAFERGVPAAPPDGHPPRAPRARRATRVRTGKRRSS